MSRLIMLALSFVFCEGISQSKDSIKCWSDGGKLKWCDFKGKIPANNDKLSNGASSSSVPKTHVLKENDSTYIYKVTATFNRYKSWAMINDTSWYLLKHEQLHFDITELYARKMRKAFKELGNWTPAVVGVCMT